MGRYDARKLYKSGRALQLIGFKIADCNLSEMRLDHSIAFYIPYTPSLLPRKHIAASRISGADGVPSASHNF